MPRAAYMICCETQTVDVTGQVSHINVLNSMLATQTPVSGPPGQPPQGLFNKLTISASWVRDPDDENSPCEFELAVRDPNGVEQVLTRAIFRFERPFHRIDILLFHPPFSMIQGIHIVESRVRRTGTQNWVSQTYPVLVDVKAAQTTT